MTSTLFRASADASNLYREGAAVDVARCTSSAETGNLAAVTKNSTFEVNRLPLVVVDVRPGVETTDSGASRIG